MHRSPAPAPAPSCRPPPSPRPAASPSRTPRRPAAAAAAPPRRGRPGTTSWTLATCRRRGRGTRGRTRGARAPRPLPA
uniref:Uncharacterized protein n=1 Tax=Arundo donax TaxID=35708 RepID=A0A0A9DBF9_ARUDO